MPLRPMGRRSNPWRMLLYVILIALGISVTRLVETGRVRRPLSPTPLPTRTAKSFAEQGKAFFSAGDMRAAIEAYENAVAVDPTNGRLWAELARIQTYSSELETNFERRRQKLEDAIASIDRVIILAPEDSFGYAIRAFVYDWAALVQETASERNKFLNEAEISAFQASELAPEDPLVLAYRAEILTDKQNWAQALDLAERAALQIDLQREVYGELGMDVYRIYGTVLESLGLYRRAIEEYEKAVLIMPNLTFLYLKIGVNYRELLEYDKALELFSLAARLNEQVNSELQDQDPVPYIAIGKTYSQQGEFFSAALNMSRAVAINPSDPDLYGRLGMVYYKARNYESAIPVLRCAVEGCSETESTAILCDLGYSDCDAQVTSGLIAGRNVLGLALANSSVEYYYTYASALAFYSGTDVAPDGCAEADILHQQLLGLFSLDAIVSSIVAENRAICANLGEGGSPAAVEPTATSMP